MGDRVAVPAPSGPVTVEPFASRLADGLEILRSWGLEPVLMGCAGPRDGYLSAPDVVRSTALNRALTDGSVQAVWAARGGYGMVRIAGLLDLDSQASSPVLGFSDISLLLSLLVQRTGRAAIHAPNVATLPTLEPAGTGALRDLLFRGLLPAWDDLECINQGVARGELLPMNLSILCSVAGTAFAPDLVGRVLVLEDTGEAAYRVDRLLMQLSLLPGFAELAGLVIGDMDGALESARVVHTVREIAQRHELPCCLGFPMGHCPRNLPVPLGVKVMLDAARGEMTVESNS